MSRIIHTLAAATAAMAIGAPAAKADIGWETSEGFMYWEASIGDTVLMTFPDGTKLFLYEMNRYEPEMYDYNAMRWVESWSGAFVGVWYSFGSSDVTCPQMRTDPQGAATSSWGFAQISFHSLRNFTLRVSACDGPLEYVIRSPG